MEGLGSHESEEVLKDSVGAAVLYAPIRTGRGAF